MLTPLATDRQIVGAVLAEKREALARLSEVGQDSLSPTAGIETYPLALIKSSPENDRLYRPVDEDDPEIQELAKSIAEKGLLEPLVIAADDAEGSE